MGTGPGWVAVAESASGAVGPDPDSATLSRSTNRSSKRRMASLVETFHARSSSRTWPATALDTSNCTCDSVPLSLLTLLTIAALIAHVKPFDGSAWGCIESDEDPSGRLPGSLG